MSITCPRCMGSFVRSAATWEPHERAALKFEPWACFGCGLAFGNKAIVGAQPQASLFTSEQIKAAAESTR